MKTISVKKYQKLNDKLIYNLIKVLSFQNLISSITINETYQLPNSFHKEKILML